MAIVESGAFRQRLLETAVRNLPGFAREFVFDDEVFAFRESPDDWQTLVTHLDTELSAVGANYHIIGSAKWGYAMDPEGFPRRFAATSDIDVAVVSERLFDEIWHALLAWNHPRRHRLQGEDLAWANLRVDEVYWGWLSPHLLRTETVTRPAALLPLRNLRTRWFAAFKGVGRYPPFTTRDVHGRLYRTQHHLILYQTESLRRLKQRLERSA